MAPRDGETERRPRRKLVKKKMPQRHASMHFPERLKYGDDAHDDVTAANGKPAQYMNQSIFSMIAAAGSKTNFHARFEDESSDSEGENDSPKLSAGDPTYGRDTPSEAPDGKEHQHSVGGVKNSGKQSELVARWHPRIPLPKLKLKTVKERNYMSQSSFLPSAHRDSSDEVPRQVTPRDAPVMSQMLAARAQLSPSIEKAEEQQPANVLEAPVSQKGTGSLASRLMDIFGFGAPEEVISGSYPAKRPTAALSLK